MKSCLYFIAFLLIAYPNVSYSDTFYRETFNYCAPTTSLPKAQGITGWTASTTGNPAGQPSTLKIQPGGSGSFLPGINSAPAGVLDGNAYWNRTARGLLIFTEEFHFDVSTLRSVNWRQRIDRQDKVYAAYGARLALYIGGLWYVSDFSATQQVRGQFERRKVEPHLLTYGTTPNLANTGIVAPTNSGVSLPSAGTVTAFGLFFIRNYEKVRIDDFALVNDEPTGTNIPDRVFEGCSHVTPDPNTNTDEDDGSGPTTPAPDPTDPGPQPEEPEDTNEIPVPTTQCNDAIDNDGDGLLDLDDPGCRSPQDNFEFGGIPPHSPTDLQASDGTNADYVQLNWNAVSGANYYYVYRSQFSQQAGDLIAERLTAPSYLDASAVPGVNYFYSVTALNEYEDESAKSNTDAGFRLSPVTDSDGDGVLDDQELLDLTDPLDPGSFQLHLKSPAFTKYNTFLGQWNFLELGASGTKTISAAVTLLAPDGDVIATEAVTIPARTQVDVDINRLLVQGCLANEEVCAELKDLDGNDVVDTYGIVQIEFNDSTLDTGAALSGRMSNYRPNVDGNSFSFAFAKELRNPTQGITYAGSNTHDPQNRRFLVPNWLELSNLDREPRDFEYLLWAQDGTLVDKQKVTVPALGARDLQAGHEVLTAKGRVRESVYLTEVRPYDGATSYFATVSRYSANAPVGVVPRSYNYAFALDAISGNGSTQLVPTSNLEGQCFSQTNWLEVVNVREIPVQAFVTFRDASGQTVAENNIVLQPKNQMHFNASMLLAKNERGVAEIRGSEPGSLVTQSLVYYHDCESNSLQTAFAVQGRMAGQDVQQGSVNTFLGMRDEIYLLSISPTPNDVLATLKTFDSGASDLTTIVSLGSYAVSILGLSQNGTLAVLNDRYGALTLKTLQPKSFAAGVLRIRMNTNGNVDFVMPTIVQ